MHTTRNGSDWIFHALSNRTRRRTIRYLAHIDEPKSCAEIATVLTDDSGPPLNAGADHTGVAVALSHKHIPVLVDAQLAERTANEQIIATDAITDAVYVLDTAQEAFD
jgi:hypothetical protein